MVGTTDLPCDVTHHCKPTQEEIDFIIEELKPFFGENYDYEVQSAWAGIRPLVRAGETVHHYGHNPFVEAFKFGVRGIANFINRKKKGSTA